jgi:hypothetical protein
MFLEATEIRFLTGRGHKNKQIEQLRRMGIPFYINAAGWPIVAKAAIEGGRLEKSLTEKPWRPEVLGT